MPFLREKSGTWSPEKIAAFVAVVLPALWLLGRTLLDDLGSRPITEARPPLSQLTFQSNAERRLRSHRLLAPPNQSRRSPHDPV
jgi:hypothetical protein